MARKASNGIDGLRQQYISGLMEKKGELERQVAQIDAELGALGKNGVGSVVKARSTVSRTKSGRARNAQPLGDAIETALKKLGKPSKVGEIMDTVLSSGYQSTSDNFRGIVNQTLIKDDRFNSKARGVYGMK